MIFIVAKFETKPEWTDRWMELVAPFTQATRAEPGNRWFDWSRSVDHPHEWVLVEAFDDDAAEAHVTSDHFKQAQQDLPRALARTPAVISESISAEDWAELGEMSVD
ncbi:putative quinol monooxygenase [Aeromicrobium sp. CF4.19]|uniref:putative quinol monooxygenase n=1 Tax=Aeromicrobium sp. CF4.19 TaxID=3373082 RepID=UPI003EE6ABC9